MAAKNDVLENEKTEMEKTGLPSPEKIAMSEEELIAGLLAAADFETDEEVMKNVQIKRNGKLFFEFMVHPLSEKEMMRLRKQSTPYYKNPGGKMLPKIEGDIRMDEFRSRKIYAATTDADRAKLWDNPKVKAGLRAKGKDILEEWEIIDAVLMGGEKYMVSNIIDDISGYNDDEELELEEYAKN
jgi:hypothetical protein